jgi:hypothetical protein
MDKYYVESISYWNYGNMYLQIERELSTEEMMSFAEDDKTFPLYAFCVTKPKNTITEEEFFQEIEKYELPNVICTDVTEKLSLKCCGVSLTVKDQQIYKKGKGWELLIGTGLPEVLAIIENNTGISEKESNKYFLFTKGSNDISKIKQRLLDLELLTAMEKIIAEESFQAWRLVQQF